MCGRFVGTDIIEQSFDALGFHEGTHYFKNVAPIPVSQMRKEEGHIIGLDVRHRAGWK